MYSDIPTRDRRHIILVLVAFWLLSAGMGLSAFSFSPNRITEAMGEAVTATWSGVLAIASLSGAYGIIRHRYRVEWVASWVAAAAIVPYVVAIWALVLDGEHNRLTMAFGMTSLMVGFIKRAVSCSAHAAKLRMIHEEVQKIADDDDSGFFPK